MSTNGSAQARMREATVLRFVSRKEQLRLRGQRNYSRYMLVTKGFVAGDSLERAQWEKESAEESVRDDAWNRHHGPVTGGASILPWRDEHKGRAAISASA